MQDWWECPEAAGPMSENTVGGLDVQALQQRSVRLPQLDQAALADGQYVPARGFDPYRMSPEQEARERAEADRKFEIRQRIEQAALAAGASALEASATVARIEREAGELAGKAANR